MKVVRVRKEKQCFPGQNEQIDNCINRVKRKAIRPCWQKVKAGEELCWQVDLGRLNNSMHGLSLEGRLRGTL